MSFKCKIFGHKWRYSKEYVTYVISNTITKSTPNGIKTTWPISVRMCLRCYNKEIEDHLPSESKVSWVSWELTKQELRDKNLNELGI